MFVNHVCKQIGKLHFIVGGGHPHILVRATIVNGEYHHWLQPMALVELGLKIAFVGRKCSLVACSSMCGCAIIIPR